MFRRQLSVLCTATLVAITVGSLSFASSASANTVTKRNIYVSETACQFRGGFGVIFGAWKAYVCMPRKVPGDDRLWYQLFTIS
ncbi:MAG: hypothetical protein JO235_13720 [Chroococcidiopsidaceae cyanobacterium CP_BM_RX_35]|nr:hypothetical protein [Chroococcidiopsidaceae cyanobacterium CP_BM_RX_35]